MREISNECGIRAQRCNSPNGYLFAEIGMVLANAANRFERRAVEIHIASGMEARSVETEGLDPKDDSPARVAGTPAQGIPIEDRKP